MKDGMVHVIINPQLEARIPPAVMDRVNHAEAQLTSGAALSGIH